MLNIELSKREITSPGLYIMRWKGRTGLVRIVGGMTKGFKTISSPKTPEAYVPGLPTDGSIPEDSLFSEPLALMQV